MTAEAKKKSPSAEAARWKKELDGAKKRLEKWHEQAQKVVDRFRDKRDGAEANKVRWNLFPSNIQTQRALLYGKTPKVTVGRRFTDASDDVARVAGEMLQRLLNTDIEKDSDSYAIALQYALDDRLLAGMGNVRVRYVAKFEPSAEQTTPAEGEEEAEPSETKTYECVETDYTHWEDQLWSAGRVFHEVTWWAFKAFMSRDELVRRFGEETGKLVPLVTKQNLKEDDEQKKQDPWGRAEIWEIWDKDSKKVYWLCPDYPDILDVQDDPLELEGFWPFPRPMMSNLTTSGFVPLPDFVLAQDLYNEIDRVSQRIDKLEEAVKVVGVYAGDSVEVQRLLTEACDNELIGVSNWGAFAEKGGLKGVIDWLPIEQIANVLTVLRDYRKELIDALYQLTGMSDIMRGQATGADVTATEQSIKAKFGSVRMQEMQNEFARFASDVQRIKAQLISKLYDAKTIISGSNIEFTPDADKAQAAVALLKNRFAMYRVEVKPENVSMSDFAAMRNERTELIGAISTFFQAAAPLVQQVPGSMPFLLEILQWTVAGLPGASQIEGVMDRAIQSAQEAAKQPQQQQPDPKVMAAQAKMQETQLKGQIDMAKMDKQSQLDALKTQYEVAGEQAKQRAQTEENVREHEAKMRINAVLKPAAPTGKPGGGK